MKDREFLAWIHARLEKVHDESNLADYMHKLRAIIVATPMEQETPNTGAGGNYLTDIEDIFPPSGWTDQEKETFRVSEIRPPSKPAGLPPTSLRDFFAAGATDADIQEIMHPTLYPAVPVECGRAEARYMHADEMLAARQSLASEVPEPPKPDLPENDEPPIGDGPGDVLEAVAILRAWWGYGAALRNKARDKLIQSLNRGAQEAVP